MRPAFVGGVKTGTVVPHDDLSAGIRAPCPDGDAQRLGILVHAVLDGVLHNGLQGQRRQAKLGKRRIVIHQKHIVKLRLFYGQVSARVLQFLGEGNEFFAGDGGEIFAKVGGEIQRDLLGQIGVELPEIGQRTDVTG